MVIILKNSFKNIINNFIDDINLIYIINNK